jgi:hypothetical protein
VLKQARLVVVHAESSDDHQTVDMEINEARQRMAELNKVVGIPGLWLFQGFLGFSVGENVIAIGSANRQILSQNDRRRFVPCHHRIQLI